MRILLTNDDGITSRGLLAAKQALDTVGEVSVIAPDSNRSAVGRGITIDRSLTVTEVELRDGSRGFATDGTPVDCVRFAELGFLGERPDLIVAGINYGVNLGDDVTYSGTVAAAFEGIVLGVPALAVSQQSQAREMDFRLGDAFSFDVAAAFTARVVDRLDDVPLPEGTLLNINVPAGDADAVEVCRLGKRIYRDALRLLETDGDNRRHFRVYGDAPLHEDEEGTDLAAVSAGRIAVTPLHFDLTAEHGLEELRAYDLARLLAPAAEELAE